MCPLLVIAFMHKRASPPMQSIRNLFIWPLPGGSRIGICSFGPFLVTQAQESVHLDLSDDPRIGSVHVDLYGDHYRDVCLAALE